jgi:hypothetical protein
MNIYRVMVATDSGIKAIRLYATDKVQAAAKVMAHENCPSEAILTVNKLGKVTEVA